MIPFLYVLISLIWGSTWVVIKVGLVGVPPFLAAGLRFLLSAFVIGLILVARRTRIAATQNLRPFSPVSRFSGSTTALSGPNCHSAGLGRALLHDPLMTALPGTFWMRSETLTAPKLAILVGGRDALLFWPDERVGAAGRRHGRHAAAASRR